MYCACVLWTFHLYLLMKTRLSGRNILNHMFYWHDNLVVKLQFYLCSGMLLKLNRFLLTFLLCLYIFFVCIRSFLFASYLFVCILSFCLHPIFFVCNLSFLFASYLFCLHLIFFVCILSFLFTANHFLLHSPLWATRRLNIWYKHLKYLQIPNFRQIGEKVWELRLSKILSYASTKIQAMTS